MTLTNHVFTNLTVGSHNSNLMTIYDNFTDSALLISSGIFMHSNLSYLLTHTRQCKASHHQSHIQTLKQHCPLFVRAIQRQQVSSLSTGHVMILLNDIYKAWLKDKLNSTPFALPGLYQPASLIPLSIWKACPSTTNGNEQAH